MCANPAVHQSLSAIRRSESLAAEYGHDAANADRLFDPTLNPKGYERVFDAVHRARVHPDVRYVEHLPSGDFPWHRDDPAIQSLPRVLFLGDTDTVHVVRDLREVSGSYMALWDLRWTASRCDIGDAPDCVTVNGYQAPPRKEIGPTWYVTVSRPPTTVCVEICGPCIAHLRALTEGTDIQAEADERDRFNAAKAEVSAWWQTIRDLDGGEE